MHSHILNSKTKCCHSARLECASFILPVDLATILPPPQTLHDIERSASSTLALYASIGVASLPSVRLVHRFPFMRFTRDHLRLVSISEINQTSYGFLGNWGNWRSWCFVCIDGRSLVYQLVLLLSVDHQSLSTHLRLSQRRPILLISKLTAAA